MQDFRMETFLAVCRVMNYTRAAEQLHLTQPAVTQQIHFLEREYGVPLFRCQGRQVQLTEAGALLRRAALTMQDDERHLRDRMRRAGSARASYRFGATLTVAEFLLPGNLARLLAARPELMTSVLQVVQRVVTRHLLRQAGLKADEGHGGAVTLIQRFGSAANLNIHLHCLVLDGVYCCDADGSPAFIEADAPTDDELHALLQTVIARLMKMLTRRGVLVEDMGQTYLAEPDADAGTQRRVAPAGGATRARGARAGHRCHSCRRVRGRDHPGRAAPHQLGAAAQARL